jgi:hypothetical protein
MSKKKVGLVVFWFGVIWSFVWGIIMSLYGNSFMNQLTAEGLSQSIWSLEGPLFLLWGLGGVPLGAIIAGIGILIYSKAKPSTIWKFGIGMFLAILLMMFLSALGHIPILFGIGGFLILLFFFMILWMWAKRRKILKPQGKIAADLQLVGYVFLLLAAWFTCGMAGMPFIKAFEGVTPSSPIHIILYTVLGWLFLFLSHRKAQK